MSFTLFAGIGRALSAMSISRFVSPEAMRGAGGLLSGASMILAGNQAVRAAQADRARLELAAQSEETAAEERAVVRLEEANRIAGANLAALGARGIAGSASAGAIGEEAERQVERAIDIERDDALTRARLARLEADLLDPDAFTVASRVGAGFTFLRGFTGLSART